MRNKLKFIILPCLLLLVMLLMVSCGSDGSPFKDYDKDGYTVSVKFDANGGVFTTNTDTIIDTYNLSGYTENSQGNKELPLFAPDSAQRKNQAYTATKDGYYLAGWYTNRVEQKDADGNVTGYTYSGCWDFEADKLSVDADQTYSSGTPIITLYAAWIPSFSYDYEFYTFSDTGTPELVGTLSFGPTSNKTINLPANDASTGRINAPGKHFPEIAGKTYDKIYLDAEKTTEVTTETLTHPGVINQETLEVDNRVMKVYCTTTEDVQYRISTPDQLTRATDLSATYTLENDLDFTGKAWSAVFTAGEFSGKFIGNDHTVKNISITQTNTANTAYGLFGCITADATIQNVTFENVTATIRGYSRFRNAAFGIFAGEILSGADISGVVLQNGSLVITKNAALYVAADSMAPIFGLVCAHGETTGVTYSAENVTVTLSGTDNTTQYSYAPDENGQFTLSIVNN